MSPDQLVVASLVIAAGSFVQGGVGFGSLLLAAPLLVLVEPRLVPGPVLVPGLVLALLMALRDRGGLQLGGVAWAFAGRVPGSVVGYVISPPFVRWLDRGYTRTAVLGLSVAAGAVLILRRLV